MWRIAIGLALLQGCKSEAPQSDAGTPCTTIPTDIPACAKTCGNGEIETCYALSSGCVVFVVDEICDGVASCQDAGYYGGPASCALDCAGIDDSACDACAPELDCQAHASTLPTAVAASGGAVAVGTLSGIDIFDGTTLEKRIAATYARALVATPDGWMVVASEPARIFTLDRDGTQGAPSSIELSDVEMSFGANSRALLAWREANDVRVAITSASGETVIPKTTMLGAGVTVRPGTAASPTSFFIGASGLLVRLGPDGTRTQHAAFPASLSVDHVTLLWGGTTGWYVSWNPGVTSFYAQRFDETGETVGGFIYADLGVFPLDFATDGTDLLALRQAAMKYEIVRFSPMGMQLSVTEVGAGTPHADRGWLEMLDGDVLAAWYRSGKLQLAVAP